MNENTDIKLPVNVEEIQQPCRTAIHFCWWIACWN